MLALAVYKAKKHVRVLFLGDRPTNAIRLPADSRTKKVF